MTKPNSTHLDTFESASASSFLPSTPPPSSRPPTRTHQQLQLYPETFLDPLAFPARAQSSSLEPDPHLLLESQRPREPVMSPQTNATPIPSVDAKVSHFFHHVRLGGGEREGVVCGVVETFSRKRHTSEHRTSRRILSPVYS